MADKSTPRPWTLDVEMDGDEGYSIAIPEIGRMLHDTEWASPEDWGRDLANVRMIVRAVNCHDELVAALYKCRDHLYSKQDMDRCRELVKAALLKAEAQHDG